jgi:hypothetical protein
MRRPALHRPTVTVTGPGWVHPYTGATVAPFVLYADGGDPQTPPAPAPAAPTPANMPGAQAGGPATAPGTFTQDEVNALAAKEKDQGRRAGARDALKEFAEKNGFSSIDDAAAFIAAGRQAQQDALSEQERQQQQLAQDRKAVDEERAQLATERRTLLREQALTRLGALDSDDAPNLQDALAMLDRDLREEPDADAAAVTAKAEALKKRRPELFGATPTAPAPAMPPAPGGAPAGGPPQRTPSKAMDAVREDARRMAIDMGFRRADDAA